MTPRTVRVLFEVFLLVVLTGMLGFQIYFILEDPTDVVELLFAALFIGLIIATIRELSRLLTNTRR
jgi:hypothetical protein